MMDPLRPTMRFAALCALLLGCATPGLAHARVPHGRLFPPDDLGLLEGPDRDAWQKPELSMDALWFADGATVADVGAGDGWFTVRLAPGAGRRLVIRTRRYANQPTLAFPWDRGAR